MHLGLYEFQSVLHSYVFFTRKQQPLKYEWQRCTTLHLFCQDDCLQNFIKLAVAELGLNPRGASATVIIVMLAASPQHQLTYNFD